MTEPGCKRCQIITQFIFICATIPFLGGGFARNVPLPLGIVFEQGPAEVQSAFKHALLTFTPLNATSDPNDVYRFSAYVDTINTADAFKLSKLICNQFSRGIYAMLGSMNSESFHTYHAFANTFQMPIITPWYPPKDTHFPKPSERRNANNGAMDFATRLRPDLNPAILETIHYYGWQEVIFMYSSNEGLTRLQNLFYRSPFPDKTIRVKLVKKISNWKDAIHALRDVEASERFSHKYVILDCPTPLAKEIIVNHVRDIRLGRRTYHYMLIGLVFDEIWERDVLEYTAVNVTGFRLVDTSRKYVQDFLAKWSSLDTSQFPGAGKASISANAALMYDSMLVIKEAFTDILSDKQRPFEFKSNVAEPACDSGSDFLDDIRPFEHGRIMNQHLRRVQTEGLTGNIQFHENGTRKYFSVDVIELGENSVHNKIGQWSDFGGFKAEASFQKSGLSSTQVIPDDVNTNKMYIVTSILEEPYLQLKKAVPGKPLTGNDMYEGYIKDFADSLFQKLGLRYRIKLSKDGKHGTKVPTTNGDSWNGMVGEVLRKDADMAIAPLTITADRERVIEFTKPFLSQGISIMVYKPRKTFPGMFSFLSPMSEFAWLGILGAYFFVSGVLYIIYKLTTAHYQQSNQRINEDYTQKFITGKSFIPNNGNGPCTSLHHHVIQPAASIIPGEKLTVSNVLWAAFSILAYQQRGITITSRSLAAKLASCVWWIFALLVISMYIGNYVAIRMQNRVLSSIHSPWDLVDKTSIQYGTLSEGSSYEFLKYSENQVYKAMFQHISGPNQLNARTYEEGINLVRQKKGKYVFILESTKNEFVSNKRPCNTMRVGKDLTDIHYGIGLPYGSPLTQVLNLEILKMRESGELRQLEEKWWMNRNECHIAAKIDEMQSSLTDEELSLRSLAGIFYVLIVGMVVAIAVSFLEFFCSSNKNKDPQRLKIRTSQVMKQRNPNIVIGSPPPNDFRDIPASMSPK